MRLRVKLLGLLLGAGLLMAVCGTLGVGVASADIIYNNLGPGNSYDTLTGNTIQGSDSGLPISVGEPFTPATTFTLSDISLPLGSQLSTATSVNVVLTTSDATGLPGTALETWTLLAPDTSGGSVLTVTDSLNEMLNASKRYWVTVLPESSGTLATWFFASGDPMGSKAVNMGSGWSSNFGTLPGLRVDGTLVSVPEPSSLALMASGIAGVLWFVRSRRRRQIVAAVSARS